MAQTLQQLTAGFPPPLSVPASAVAQVASDSARILVVLDDDPTGTQSVADLPVLTDWTVESLAWGLGQGRPAIYVMTNSRSVDPDVAERRNREVADAAYDAAESLGVEIAFVSRSDSTLRGHFPLEPQVLADAVIRHEGRSVDGVVIIPAFGDAGRITVGGVHYAGNPADGYTPVGETEFARDTTFGYRSSDLREWVEEKTGGATKASDVIAISLDTLRTNIEAATQQLRSAHDVQPVICDIVDEADLRQLSLALQRAEDAGSRFIYRVGPPFVRARIGQDVHPPLEHDDLAKIYAGGLASDAVGGLVVVGSHVSMTTRQLDALRRRRAPVELEIDVAQVLDDRRDAHLAGIVAAALADLPQGNVVIRTSRTLVKASDARSSLALSRDVSSAVVEVVQQVLADYRPRFVVAKGGITSSDVAALGLGIERAFVRGPMLPGIVSLWEPMNGPARGIPYIVFAGNVGGVESLADVVDKLSS